MIIFGSRNVTEIRAQTSIRHTSPRVVAARYRSFTKDRCGSSCDDGGRHRQRAAVIGQLRSMGTLE